MASDKTAVSRRSFLHRSAVAAAATAGTGSALLSSGNYAFAQGSDTLKVGVVGCGGRGSGAASNILEADPATQIVAIGDAFEDRAKGCRDSLTKQKPDRVKLPDDRVFVGLDAYKKVIDSGVDIVILATPPGFRPLHLKAAVDAGKHVFVEKPVGVDPAGIRSVFESADRAKQKNLAIVAGTQRRHENRYRETIKRIHDGAIGDIVGAQCYWNQGGLWMHKRKPEWSDAEWQIRNWLYFTWLSGDHIVEQHVHNIDVINWAMNAHPVKALGMGGRQVRTDPAYGHIFDHFTIEFEYPNGMKMLSMCRQIDGTASRVGESLVGTKGTSNAASNIKDAKGQTIYRFEGSNPNPYVQEHVNMIASIRAGKPLNEGRQVAESTLTAIMGRLSAYTGQEVTWDQMLAMPIDIVPAKVELGPLPVAPVPVPGRTKLEDFIARTA
ncbi:MAG TPA: Gfo/Idh/MocA family oxidoreductase [Armatimonadaceae bacterium]|jgi:predicted dehydrogenase|nr:Gfo/Idh/MocA family oxidoreductase [Armatimonadaceae bacterium]